MRAILDKEGLTLPPLHFALVSPDQRFPRIDAIFEAKWRGHTYRFVAEIKARSTPQALVTAAHQAKAYAFDLHGAYPLVIVPYLAPSQVDEAESLGISVVDLNGNGIVSLESERVLVSRSGRPNRFRKSEPLRGAYRGTSSLVARALVLRHQFARVTDLFNFVTAKGGHLTLATVSKALRRLTEDLIVARDADGLRVLQPIKLLDRLGNGYRPPRITGRWVGKIPVPADALHRKLLVAAERAESRLVLTGVSSASHYTVLAAEPITSFYASARPEDLIRAAKLEATSTNTFPNVEILQTDAEEVFFDLRNEGTHILSSPVQAWLELSIGDKRLREAGMSLRSKLVNGEPSPKGERRGD
ncbi:MAG TPA: hypothetical protein VL463_08940 [Kofleriaceae bacterium]|nr:hypothetical protein [Kofleriaceae bacterium]